MSSLPRCITLQGDALRRLRELPDASVDMVLASPPYFRLRDYGESQQLGTETRIDAWVANLAGVAADVRRVLVPTGTFWLNLGDTYATQPRQGVSRKSLLLGPERLALTLLRDGWLLRNKLVWQKANPMPISVTDRLSCTWEVIYVFARQPTYFFDLDAIRLPHVSRPKQTGPRARGQRDQRRGPNAAGTKGLAALKAQGLPGHPLGKNPGDVWRLPSSNYRGDHPAMFPVALAERALQAGCPEARCTICRSPWRRPLIRALGSTALRGALTPTCGCEAAPEPGLVLDPFMGAGSTAVAAERLHRDWLGIELNPGYIELARRRLQEARAGPRAA